MSLPARQNQPPTLSDIVQLALHENDSYKAPAMILCCPSCQSRFLVAASLFAAGPRVVHCARCAHDWRAEMPQEPAAALAAQLAQLTPAPDVAKTAKSTASAETGAPARAEPVPFWRRPFMIGVAILMAVLLGWFLLDRDTLAHDHPWLGSLYGHIGLAPYHPGEGLNLDQVRSELQFENGITQLVVEGQIRNGTDKTLDIPNLLAAAIGSDGKAMQSWQIDAPAAKVAPGAALPFRSVIHAPKGTVASINLTFVEPQDAP